MKRRILSLLLAVLMLAGMVLATGIGAVDEETGYPDVPAGRWSAEDIIYVTEQGMMTDTGKGNFEPTKAVTRAMVVTVLHRLAGEPESTRTNKITDVPEGKWYSEAVAWGVENKIVTGFSDNTFRPLENVTREQLVTFIGRYAELKFIEMNGTELNEFTDGGKIKDYALDYFKWAVKVGLVNGVTETEIRPTAGATREQFAAIMHRFDTSEVMEYELHYQTPTVYSTYTEKDYPLRDDADFFVSTTGNDSNDGKTIDTAFATFERAKEAVRQIRESATDEIVVAFMAGNYGSLDNITFTAEDAGSEAAPITYCAYGDGDVIFSNGVTVYNEEFTPIEESDYSFFKEKNYDSIYKAYIGDRLDSIGQFTVLFDDSQICWEARFPNKNAKGIDEYLEDMSTRVDQFSSIELQMRAKSIADGFAYTEGMKITGHLRTGWLIDTFLVESYDPETGIVVFDFDNPDFYSWGSYPMVKWEEGVVDENGDMGEYVLMYEERYDDSIFFHNIPDQLDQEGEYWIDTNTMTLYVYNPNGDYTFSKGGTFMTVNSGADYINFAGLRFDGSEDTAIYSNSDHVTYDLCTFSNISGACVISASGVHNFEITNCEFYNFGCQGINLVSDASKVKLESGNNRIYNNYFHNFGYVDYWKNAISISDCKCVVSHNVFENGAHGGVVFSGPLNVIEYNIFDRMMISTEDFGCVYTWNSSRYRSNEIRYNIFMNIDGGSKYSVYLDEMTHGQIVHGNLFYKAGVAVVKNGGRDNEIYNNAIVQTGTFSSSAKLYEYYEENKLEEFKPGDEGDRYNLTMTGFPQEGDPMYETWKSLWPIMYEYTTDISKLGEPECVFSNTNYYRNNVSIGHAIHHDDPTDKYVICGVFENNLEYDSDENPLFVNPTIGDYRIREDADFFQIPIEHIGRE